MRIFTKLFLALMVVFHTTLLILITRLKPIQVIPLLVMKKKTKIRLPMLQHVSVNCCHVPMLAQVMNQEMQLS